MQIIVKKAHNLSQLGEELFAAFPAWRELRADGRYWALASVSGGGNTVTVICPDTTTKKAVEAVITAHIPNPDYRKDVESDVALSTLQAYVEVASPTAVQTAAATKALLTVLTKRGLV